MMCRRGSARPALTLGLLAFIGAGCFGSQYRDEGRYGSAATVVVQDCVGLGLVGLSAFLLHEASQVQEPNIGTFAIAMAAGFAGAGGGGLIWNAETRYSRGKYGHGAERGVEMLRLSDPPRLRKLLWMKLGGLSLAVGGMVMGSAYDQDTLSIVGSSLSLAGILMVYHADRSLKSIGEGSRSGVAFGPGSIALVHRF